MADRLLEKHKELETTVDRLLGIAQHSDSEARVISAVTALTRLIDQAFGRVQAANEPDPDDETTPWEAYTPAQRAKARATLDAWLREQDEMREVFDDAHSSPR